MTRGGEPPSEPDDAVQVDLVVGADDDVPRRPATQPTGGDRVFRTLSIAAASVSLIIVGVTLVFLIKESRPAFESSGSLGLLHDERLEPEPSAASACSDYSTAR